MIIKGVVQQGRQLGRQLSFPTANIAVDSGLKVESGVYLSVVTVGGCCHAAVTNIGTNPTVGATERRAESHLLDFSDDLYNIEITIELGDMLRREQRFASLEALRAQIEKDVIAAREYFSRKLLHP